MFTRQPASSASIVLRRERCANRIPPRESDPVFSESDEAPLLFFAGNFSGEGCLPSVTFSVTGADMDVGPVAVMSAGSVWGGTKRKGFFGQNFMTIFWGRFFVKATRRFVCTGKMREACSRKEEESDVFRRGVHARGSIALFSVALLWCSSLSSCGALVDLVLPAPAWAFARKLLNSTLEASRRAEEEYAACATRQGDALHATASRGKKGGALASFIQGIPEQQHGGGLPSNCASLHS